MLVLSHRIPPYYRDDALDSQQLSSHCRIARYVPAHASLEATRILLERVDEQVMKDWLKADRLLLLGFGLAFGLPMRSSVF